MYFTYIIRCKDDSLYTGYTTDIVRRMKEHESGINCKYSKLWIIKDPKEFLETLENKECYNIPYNE